MNGVSLKRKEREEQRHEKNVVKKVNRRMEKEINFEKRVVRVSCCCKLEQFEQVFSNLVDLIHVNLSNNKLEMLPPQIRRLTLVQVGSTGIS